MRTGEPNDNKKERQEKHNEKRDVQENHAHGEKRRST